MPLAPENTCECGSWKGEDFELCKECSDAPVLVTFARRVGESDLSVLYKLKGGFMARSLYVPKSVLVSEDAAESRFCVPRWWAEQEGVEYES